MLICNWNKLNDEFKNEQVKPFYDDLRKKNLSLFFKRIFDVFAALILLILLSPIFLFLAIWIKLDSSGPVFFRQVRVTTYGKHFKIFKFRTMVVDAPNLGSAVTVKNDARITKVGLKIRNHRLDELPQLINVLIGQMSFVGTRPEVPKYVDQYTPVMRATLLLPAGITSLASIKFKDEEKLLECSENPDITYVEKVLPQKMKYNLEYLENYSFWKDIKLCFKTITSV